MRAFNKIVTYGILSLWSLTTLFPLLWVINNSLKPSAEVLSNSFKLALDPTWLNYDTAFSKINIMRSYANSIFMSGSAVFLVLLFGGMAAFVLARFRFRLRASIMMILVASLLIPSFAVVLPVYEMFIHWGWVNHHISLIIAHTAGNMPFAILVIASYMATIPKDMEEAAAIDGASRLRMFTHIFVPISKPIFATATVFVFLWSFNDLFSALFYVNASTVRPIVALLNEISSQYGTDFGLMAAAITLTVIPVFIVYLSAQRFFERGLAAGAVKG